MTELEIGALGFTAVLVLIALRIPIAVSMLAVGMIGYSIIAGPSALLSYLKTETYWRFSSYDLSVAPLFILMGQFAARAGLSASLFKVAYTWIGHLRGGVAMAAIGGCAGFGAISGSSLATASIMGQAALPELRRYKYSGALSTGTLAAGGTLGILIPPSLILIIYGILVEANIATLFQAALLPGLLATMGYIIAIAIYVRFSPDSGPAGPRSTYKERLYALLENWPVILIFTIVMGGIFSGIFSPTEGAGIGCISTLFIAVVIGGMRMQGFLDSLLGAAETTGLIFLIILGASVFNAFLGFSELPLKMAEFFQHSGYSPMLILILMLVLYLVMGCVMDSLSMILLTIPIFWPIIKDLDYGLTPDDLKLWFGILALMVVEVGLITPPIGLNVFVINSIAKDIPMLDTFRGVIPFLITDFIRISLIVIFPALVLALPYLWRIE